MIEVSDNLWLEVDPEGRVLIGCHDRVVRIEPEEREQVVQFIRGADQYHAAKIAQAESQREELTIDDRILSQNNG